MSCNICKSKTKKKKILTRSNKKLYVHICSKCDYEFFTHDPYQKLKKNKLDISRLKKAGLKIQTISDQFKNGQTQSKKYIKQYSTPAQLLDWQHKCYFFLSFFLSFFL